MGFDPGSSSGGGGGGGEEEEGDDVHADLVPHLVLALQEMLGPAAGAAAAAAVAPSDRKRMLTDLFQHQAAVDPSGTLAR